MSEHKQTEEHRVTHVRQDSPLQKILRMLSVRTGHDFSLYKKNTLYRRIARRAALQQIEGITEYARFLAENPEELDALFREFLIGVTKFFRDPATFDYLESAIISDIVKRAAYGGSIRVWVPGCSSGEEAYSIAILLRECVDKFQPESSLKIQVFATDIDSRAIAIARKGSYPTSIEDDVSPQRLEQFFTRVDGGYVIKKLIRETVVFAPQDLTADPPFTKMDMVSCRNLLIYFSQELQRKVIPVFHYALNPNGILLLGTAEGIGGLDELFSTIDCKWKIYRRKDSESTRTRLRDIPCRAPLTETRKFQRPEMHVAMDVQEALRRTLLERYAPPSIVVNASGEILIVSGNTGKYLEQSQGQANWTISAMAREGLRPELAMAIHKAGIYNDAVVLNGLSIKTNGGYQIVNVTVSPLRQPNNSVGLLAVTFEDVGPPRIANTSAKPSGEPETEYEELKRELSYTKERLHTTEEEMHAVQEELRSANEELQSTNEELQSTNEELTTSKEDLQSSNQQLTALNTELQSKVDDLTRDAVD